MKRLISLLCALCLLFSLSVAEAYEATNPYTIENIGMTIDLPEARTSRAVRSARRALTCGLATTGGPMSATQ